MPTTKSSKPVSKSPAKSPAKFAKSTSKPAKSVRKTKGIGGTQPEAIQLPTSCTPAEMNQYVQKVQGKFQEELKKAKTDNARNALELMRSVEGALKNLLHQVTERVNTIESLIQSNSPS